MTDKPPFDPSQPFEAVAQLKPDFDPSQPFEVADPVTLNKLVRSGATGVPVIGGFLNKANAITNALLAPAIEPFLSESPESLREPTLMGNYRKSLAIQNKQDERFAEQHPIIDTAAQLAGGIGATIPAAAGVLGTGVARAMGMGGNTLLGQTARSAASGGAINAADAAIRGNDPTTAGLIGTGVGAAAPAIGRGAGMMISPVVDTIRGIMNPAEEAARRVGRTVQRAQELNLATPGNPRNALTPQEAIAAEAAGSPTNVMDTAGEPGRNLAKSAANTSAEGSHILNQAIDQRFDTQSGRMAGWLRSTFHYPDAGAQQQALANVERTSNQAAYGAAQGAADVAHPGGIWSPELERLTSSPDIIDAMKTAAERGKGRAVAEGYGGFNPGVTFENGLLNFRRGPTGVPSYPDLRFWDYTYRNIRDAATSAFRAGRNSEGSALQTQAGALRSELDRMVPEFGQARAGAAQFFGAHNAIEAGQNFAMPGAKFGNAEARQAIGRMSAQERQLFQDGFVDRLAQMVSETGTRRNVSGLIGNSDAAIERLHIALGPQRAGQVEAMLRLERLMDMARPAVQGNSSTARQLTQLGLAGGVGTLSAGGNPLSAATDPQALTNAALTYGALRGRTAVNERVARQVAELLASNNHARVAQGMRIAGQQRFLNALRTTDAALARTGSVQAEPQASP